MVQIDFSEVLDLKKIKLMGYTTDYNSCDCCGKENLKGTISVLLIEQNIVAHLGTTCAATANKYDTLNTVREIKKMVREAVKNYNDKEMQNKIDLAKLEYEATRERKIFKEHRSNFSDWRSMSNEDINKSNELFKKAEMVKYIIMETYGIPKNLAYKLA